MSVEYEGLKKTLGGSETAKEIDETEKRLKVRTVCGVLYVVCCMLRVVLRVYSCLLLCYVLQSFAVVYVLNLMLRTRFAAVRISCTPSSDLCVTSYVHWSQYPSPFLLFYNFPFLLPLSLSLPALRARDLRAA